MSGERQDRPSVEIIAIGHELLLGDVLDTNTHWLCRQITQWGGQVTRAVMVDDDVETIGRELRGALGRGSHLILTTGGLGPTEDDRTLEAIARGLGRPLAEQRQALALVEARYEQLAAEGYVEHRALSPSRRKMALLPRGADPLANPVGAAPGVALAAGDTTVVALPGVPAELKAIFTTSLRPLLAGILGRQAWLERSVRVECGDESVLAPILQAVDRVHPEVYIKSLAQQFGPDQWLTVTLSASGPTDAEAEGRVSAASDELRCRLARANIACQEEA